MYAANKRITPFTLRPLSVSVTFPIAVILFVGLIMVVAALAFSAMRRRRLLLIAPNAGQTNGLTVNGARRGSHRNGRQKSNVNSRFLSDKGLRANNGSRTTSQTAPPAPPPPPAPPTAPPTAGRGHSDDQIYQNVTFQSERGNGNVKSNVDDVRSTVPTVGVGEGYDVYIGEEKAEPLYDKPCTVIESEAGKNTDANRNDSPSCDSTDRKETESLTCPLRKPSLKPKPKSLKNVNAAIVAAGFLKQGNNKQNVDVVNLVENEIYVTEDGTNSNTPGN